MFRVQVTIIRQTFQYTDMTCHVHVLKYLKPKHVATLHYWIYFVFGLNDILVSTATQRDGSYKNDITNSCIWNTSVTWQGTDYKLPEDDTIVSKRVGVLVKE